LITRFSEGKILVNGKKGIYEGSKNRSGGSSKLTPDAQNTAKKCPFVSHCDNTKRTRPVGGGRDDDWGSQRRGDFKEGEEKASKSLGKNTRKQKQNAWRKSEEAPRMKGVTRSAHIR